MINWKIIILSLFKKFLPHNCINMICEESKFDEEWYSVPVERKLRKGSDLHRELYLTFENRLKKTYGKKKIVGNRWTFSSSFLRSTNHETKSINFSLEFNHLQIKRIFESIFSVWSICVLTVAESIKSPGFLPWTPAYFLS